MIFLVRVGWICEVAGVPGVRGNASSAAPYLAGGDQDRGASEGRRCDLLILWPVAGDIAPRAVWAQGEDINAGVVAEPVVICPHPVTRNNLATQNASSGRS